MTHEHDWKVAFTETKNNVIIKSHLHCQDKECDEWQEVEGAYTKEEEVTWKNSAARITK